VIGEPRHPGRASKQPEILRWAWGRLEALSLLSSQPDRVSVSAMDLRTETLPLHLPHRVSASILVTYPDPAAADAIEALMRAAMGRAGPKWELKTLSDRPPMLPRKTSGSLARTLAQAASTWEIPLKTGSSVLPSVAGLAPPSVPCLCGVGPVARDIGTPSEAVNRMSLIQRTLMLAQFLHDSAGERPAP
jgi:D-alanine-D-alanine ligase